MKIALRALRDELLAEQKEKEVRGFKDTVHPTASCDCLSPRNTKDDVLKNVPGGFYMRLHQCGACNGDGSFQVSEWIQELLKSIIRGIYYCVPQNKVPQDHMR